MPDSPGWTSWPWGSLASDGSGLQQTVARQQMSLRRSTFFLDDDQENRPPTAMTTTTATAMATTTTTTTTTPPRLVHAPSTASLWTTQPPPSLLTPRNSSSCWPAPPSTIDARPLTDGSSSVAFRLASPGHGPSPPLPLPPPAVASTNPWHSRLLDLNAYMGGHRMLGGETLAGSSSLELSSCLTTASTLAQLSTAGTVRTSGSPTAATPTPLSTPHPIPWSPTHGIPAQYHRQPLPAWQQTHSLVPDRTRRASANKENVQPRAISGLTTAVTTPPPPVLRPLPGNIVAGSRGPRSSPLRDEAAAIEDGDGNCASTRLTPNTDEAAFPLSFSSSESPDGPSTPPDAPPAPGFRRPLTGYEYELNHGGNLRELQRQQQWAREQLRSCNENNRFQHTQTTACIAAVGGHVLGGYHAASLRCYGTNPDMAGLRVTMTVYAGTGSEGAALVLRHQLVANTVNATPPPLTSHGRPQGRRYLFATTTLPLRGGVPGRPGYRPLLAADALVRLRRWGACPEQGVFGNAWLIQMAVEPGHARHTVDAKMVEQVARWAAPPAPAPETNALALIRRVNERMATLTTQESTLSLLLSNHGTQKRIARQCPDLVAMWVLAQENL